MPIRDHLIAILVHGGILLAIFLLCLTTSCEEPPPPPEPDPVGDFFDNLLDALEESGAESVTVIAVDDNIHAGIDLQRQVFQEIQAQLHLLRDIQILEFPTRTLEQMFQEMGIVPSEGISPEDAVDLCADLRASSLLYASIESIAPDVHIKLYSGESGSVVFAETLQEWPLPVTRDEESLDLFAPAAPAGMLDDAESTGEISEENLEGEPGGN